MPYQGSITLVDLSDGTSGIDSATIYLYQRAAANTTPGGPDGTLTYTFSTHSLSGTTSAFNGWQQSIPSGTNPIWIIAATATASADIGSDDILKTEWSSPTIMAQDGQGGEHGVNTATVYIYKRTDSAPDTPTPGSTSYTFSNGSFTVPTGWSKTIPATDNGKPCYVSSAVAIGNDATATLVWSTPVVLVEDGAQGPQGISVTSERELYWLKTNSTNPSQIIWDSAHSQPSQTIYSDDRTNAWTSAVPTYGSSGTYYTCIEASLSDGTKVWSAPVINNALTNTSSNTALMGGHFIYLGSASASGLTQPSANVVQTIIADNQDVTYDPTKWEHNVHIGSNGIALRYNELNYSTWTTNGLHLFEPPNGSTQGAEAATLTTDGLVLTKGGIIAGTPNTNNYIYLSTEDYPLKDDSSSEPGITINGYTPTAIGTDGRTIDDPGWREIIGTLLGVTADGSLYASNVDINGRISATEGTIGGFVIRSGELYSLEHNTYDANTSGIYIGTEKMAFGPGGKIWFDDSGQGQIGSWSFNDDNLSMKAPGNSNHQITLNSQGFCIEDTTSGFNSNWIKINFSNNDYLSIDLLDKIKILNGQLSINADSIILNSINVEEELINIRGIVDTHNTNINSINNTLSIYNNFITIDNSNNIFTIKRKALSSASTIEVQDSTINLILANEVITKYNNGLMHTTFGEFENLRMRTGNNEGNLTWIARSNGHLSLKVVS